jgi:hypothetical protein
MAAKHDYQNWLDGQAKTPDAEKAFMAGYAAAAKELSTTRALLQLAVERMTAFCDAVAPASAITEALRNAGLGAAWNGLMQAAVTLPSAGVHVWEVEHQKEGCAACPAGRAGRVRFTSDRAKQDYRLAAIASGEAIDDFPPALGACLVSMEDVDASTCPGVPAPDGCPLRNGGSVLLVGEP